MLDTSKDILFLAIAMCVVVFTFFLCWVLYYLVMMLKKAYQAIKEVSDLVASLKEKLNRLESLFQAVEEKIKNSAAYLPLVMKGVSELIGYLKRRKEKKAANKKSKQ